MGGTIDTISVTEIHSCRIDCVYSWRPDFDDNIVRLRFARFSDKLLVTHFDDASEGETASTVVFQGDAETPWRKVVFEILNDETAAVYNPEWPFEVSMAGLGNLHFDPDPNMALRMCALAWLGTEWRIITKALLRLSDSELIQIDRDQGILRFAGNICAEIEDVDWCEYEGDLDVDDFIDAMIAGEVNGANAADIAERLFKEGSQEE